MSKKLYKLLVVDDEEPIRKILIMFFSSPGLKKLIDLEIKEFEDGLSAWEHIDSKDVDIVITDINMPGIDGFELTRRARAKKPEMLIIAITGLPTGDQVEKIIVAGANNILPKPFSLKTILGIIKDFLANK